MGTNKSDLKLCTSIMNNQCQGAFTSISFKEQLYTINIGLNFALEDGL